MFPPLRDARLARQTRTLARDCLVRHLDPLDSGGRRERKGYGARARIVIAFLATGRCACGFHRYANHGQTIAGILLTSFRPNAVPGPASGTPRPGQSFL